jgi:hypothetical protein
MTQTTRHGGRPQSRRPRWHDPRGRHLGTWAFVANLVGLVVVVAAVRILA